MLASTAVLRQTQNRLDPPWSPQTSRRHRRPAIPQSTNRVKVRGTQRCLRCPPCLKLTALLSSSGRRPVRSTMLRPLTHPSSRARGTRATSIRKWSTRPRYYRTRSARRIVQTPLSSTAGKISSPVPRKSRIPRSWCLRRPAASAAGASWITRWRKMGRNPFGSRKRTTRLTAPRRSSMQTTMTAALRRATRKRRMTTFPQRQRPRPRKQPAQPLRTRT